MTEVVLDVVWARNGSRRDGEGARMTGFGNGARRRESVYDSYLEGVLFRALVLAGMRIKFRRRSPWINSAKWFRLTGSLNKKLVKISPMVNFAEKRL